jgi:Cys-rich protein (TIGR01571 family)
MASSSLVQKLHQPPCIRVVAPATLEEGYTFDVMLEGVAFTVTVPEGGVVKGEEFEIPYPSPSSDETVGVQASTDDDDEAADDVESNGARKQKSPLGWRTSLCSCCDVSTQATFWLGLFCTPVLLAQIITRLKLNWRGRVDTREETSLSFNKILFGFIAVLILGYLPIAGYFIVAAYLLLIIVGVGKNVRASMRRKYNIDASTRCESFDDCCCMCFCGACSAIQMARHTHDDKEYPGYCCTTTGLELDAPLIV